MHDSIEVKAYFFESLSQDTAIELGRTEHASLMFLENAAPLEYKREIISVVSTNAVERSAPNAVGIEFIEGYDMSSFGMVSTTMMNNICVVDAGISELYGIEPGDTIRLCDPMTRKALVYEYYDADADDDVIREQMELIESILETKGVVFTVVGRLTCSSRPNVIYVPVTKSLYPVLSA